MFWWNIDRNWLWICHSGWLFCFRHACRANPVYHLRIGNIRYAYAVGPGFEWRVACREQSPRYTRICSLALCRRRFDKTILNRFIFATGGGAPGYSSIAQSVERMTVNLPLGEKWALSRGVVLIHVTSPRLAIYRKRYTRVTGSSPVRGAKLGQQFCTLTQMSLIFKGFSCF